ncbi:MAG: helix-turn-helix domain-containing protein [Chloroflexi bacterium]|nr:helix-turn-helix domain-containing protein [Chloroflexota bacterium]MDA1146517.1 helix-turn-helix domain-containing protein [Chloroflexota bacterium]
MAENLAAWMRARLQERGESQRQFSARVGVAPNTVKDWLRGAQPTWDNCQAIAAALDADVVEVWELAGYAQRALPARPGQTSGAGDRLEGVPVITADQLVSAGPGATVLGESAGGARYVALRVAGDSMVPDVLEGDTVVIDLEQSQPDPGAIVVAVVSDQVYVKRLRRPGGGRTRLQSADGSLLADSPEQTFRVVQIRRDV